MDFYLSFTLFQIQLEHVKRGVSRRPEESEQECAERCVLVKIGLELGRPATSDS